MMPTAEPAPDPNELHERARRLLSTGDAAAAFGLLEQVVILAPRHLPFWLSLAAALRALGPHEAELDALEHALALDPTHLVVLLQKGALLDLVHKPRSAATVYGHALQTLTPGTKLPALIDKRLGALRSAAPGAAQMRFDRCLDRTLGRRRIYVPEPTFMLFPFLRNYEFFEREHFPWLAALEAATGSIREELVAALALILLLRHVARNSEPLSIVLELECTHATLGFYTRRERHLPCKTSWCR